MSDVALYCRQAKLKLPFKSFAVEFKSGKIRIQMMLDGSKDKVIKSLNPTLKTGKNWKVRDTIRSAKINLTFKEIIGLPQTRRKELMKSSGDQKLLAKIDLVIQDVRSKVDNERFIK